MPKFKCKISPNFYESRRDAMYRTFIFMAYVETNSRFAGTLRMWFKLSTGMEDSASEPFASIFGLISHCELLISTSFVCYYSDAAHG